MSSEELLEKADAVAEQLVFCDASDLPELAELHTAFETLTEMAAGAGLSRCTAALKGAGALIEQIILAELDDPAAAMKTIGDTLSAVQAVLRDGRDEGDIEVPGEARSTSGDGGLNLPANVDATIFSEFLGRQASELDDMEELILGVENGDAQLLSEFKRQLHTLKGESAMLGLADIERVCHVTEDALDQFPPGSLTDGLFAVRDWLKARFDALMGEGEEPVKPDNMLARLRSPAAEAATAAKREAEDDTLQYAPKALDGDLELIGEFVLEALEHLENSDLHLLTLETQPQDDDALNAVFRAFHTIKGVCGFIGLDEIQALAHEAENLLDLARKGEVRLTGMAIDVVFEAVDLLKVMVDHVREVLGSQGLLMPNAGMPALLRRIQAAARGEESGAFDRRRDKDETILSNQPIGDILVERGVTTKEAIEKALAAQNAPREPRKLGEILISKNIATRRQVEEALTIQAQSGGKERLGDVLARNGVATIEDIEAAARSQSGEPIKAQLGELLVKSGTVKAHDIAEALRTQRSRDPEKDRRTQPAAVQVRESVKVDAVRLDQLVDTVGELVIAESMVVQSSELRDKISAELSRQLSQLDKITRELQEMSMSLRMVPVRATFQKMARLVRDLAKKTNKTVAFHMTGEDTELDKSVVDKIGDPLVHMVRNSVDHGLEGSAAERTRAGKPETGNVYLRAFHQGGSIHIEIEDDGKGLDRERIVSKAVERGLLKEGETLSDSEVWKLIFEPGFSTAQQLTEVSGRGVGMDVVRRNIEALRGQIDIVSERGKGSRFTIKLPLTLAIIDGMVLRVGKHRYVLPTLNILVSVRPEQKDLSTVANNGKMLKLQDRLLPLQKLAELFDIEADTLDPTEGTVVVVENSGRRTALLIDEILGQQQIVIKPLGDSLRGTPGIAGGAIMPDGRVGLILDVASLVKMTRKEST